MKPSEVAHSPFKDTSSWYLRTSAFWFATSFKWFILFILLPLQVGTLAKTGEANQAWGQVVANEKGEKEKEKGSKMQIRSLHSFSCTAKQVAMPTYWSAINLGNDREPGTVGSKETKV